MFRVLMPLTMAIALGGCTAMGGGEKLSASLPGGAEAQAMIAGGAATPVQKAAPPADYRIGPDDTINVSVFQEPELSGQGIKVNATENIELPLIGTVPAAGRTASELRAVIADRLGAKYLENPQVNVSVSSAVSQRIVVQGQVNAPGVYDIRGRTTLLEALAHAKGESPLAALNEVVVFRNINNQRMGAVFDVKKIRRGQADDPEVKANDLIVVGYSTAKSLWRDLLTATPLLGFFTLVR